MSIDRVIDSPRHQDPNEPTRLVLEEHRHVVREDETDEWVIVPVRGCVVDSHGPHIELGPFSLSPADARLLALSLTMLADMVDPDRGQPAEAPMTATYTACRYLRRNDERCTAEALDPDGPILICAKHAARVMQMVTERTAAVRCGVAELRRTP